MATSVVRPVQSRRAPLRAGRSSTALRIVLVALLGVSMLPLSPVPPAQAAEHQRSVTVTLEETPAAGNDAPLRVDVDGFDVANDLIATVRVDEGDVLVVIPGGSDVSFATGYETKGPERTFSGSHADMVAVLEQHVRWEAPDTAVTTDVTVTVTEAPTGDGFFFFPSHPDGLRFYQYVSSAKSWWDARNDAAGRDLLDRFSAVNGEGSVPGYLTTITSEAENNFIANNTTAENIWIGASDHYVAINDAYAEQGEVGPYDGQCSGTEPAEGNWYWVTGPEAATHFWTGNLGNEKSGKDDCLHAWDAAGPETDPATGEPYFASWASGEPNDHGTGGEDFAVTNWSSTSGAWNDLSTGSRTESYLVEYGGLGDVHLIPQAQGSATLTSVNAVIVSADPAHLDSLGPVDVKIELTGAVTDGLASDDPLLVTLELEDDGGSLHVDHDGRGLTLEEGYAFEGTEIGFTGTFADVTAALSDAITWQPPAQARDFEVHVAVTEIPDLTNDVFYNARTGHYYEYVEAPGITFLDALEAAGDGTELFGMPGWLATPVDEQQNRFIAEFTTAANVWIGASDAAVVLCHLDGVGLCTQHTAEGRWHWVAGPLAGTEFWRGKADGAPVDGRFSSWAPGEPNDYGSGEHYAVTNWRGTVGTWNDLRNDGGSQISGYLIEYGYLDEGVTNTAAQGRDVGTLTVLPNLPGEPEDVIVSTAHVDDDHRVNVDWAPPTDDGDGPITGYEVTITPDHGPPPQCDGTSCVFTGLQDDTSYVVEVAARNARGLGPAAVSDPVTTVAAGVADGGVAAGPETTPGEDFTGVPINATMPADRNGRINIPPGRLSRNANATDVVAVDVKLPQGLGGCLAIDAIVDGDYPNVDVEIYDDGFHAWVTGPEHRVGRALDDGVVYWDPECTTTDDGAVTDPDEDGSGRGPFEYGVADDTGNADATGVGPGTFTDIGFDPGEIGIGDGTDHRDVVLRVDNGQLQFDGASDWDGHEVDGVTLTSLDGGTGLLLAGLEGQLADLLDGDRIALTHEAELSAWASSPDRHEVVVTSGRAFARVAIPDDGGELTFDETAKGVFETAGGTVEVVDGALLITGPVIDAGQDHDAFTTFLADGVTWSPPDEQGSYPLTVELEGDGGFATTLTAPLTFEGAPGAPVDLSATWDGDELVLRWQPGVPAGLPAATYTASTGGATDDACSPDAAGTYECRIAASEVHAGTDGSIAITVEASNEHGSATGTATTPAALDDQQVTLSADTDRVRIDWDPAEVAGDEFHLSLDPDGGTCVAAAAAGTCTIYDVASGTDQQVLAVVRGTVGDSDRVDVGSITPLAVTLGSGDGTEDPQAAADGDAVPLPIDLDLPGTWSDPVTVEVAIPAEAGELKIDGHGVVSPSHGHELTISGTKAEVQAALDDLSWTPSTQAGSHTLTIDASDDEGRSAQLSRELTVYAALSAPTDVAAVRDGTTVTVEWGEPEGTGASPLDRYEVTIGAHLCVETTTPLRCVLDNVSTSLRDVTVTVFNEDAESASATYRLPSSDGGGSPGDDPDEPVDDAPESSTGGPGLGDAEGTVDGEAVEVEVSGDGSSVTISGDGYSIRATPGDAEGTPTGGVEGTSMQLRTGGTALIDVSGFSPASEVRAWLFSDPLLLGTFEVADDGTLEAATGLIPADVSACAHTLTLEGTTGAGQQVTLSLGVWVQADPYPFRDASHEVTHGPQIGCVASIGVAEGVGDGAYDPAGPVQRGQMATFIARLLGLDTSGTSAFTDSQGTTHDGAIAAVVEAGIASGYPDGTFDPSQPISREQMATMLAAAANLDVEEVTADRYDDLTGGVHDGAIEAVSAAGIAMGHDDGTFRPTESVSRAQMASFLVRIRQVLANEG